MFQYCLIVYRFVSRALRLTVPGVILASVQLSKSFANAPVTLSPLAKDEEREMLPAIVKATLKKHFAFHDGKGDADKDNLSMAGFAKRFAVAPRFHKRAGLFVTLSKAGETRACWGSLEGRYEDLVKATVYTTEAALTNEYRFSKITASEVDWLKPQVTVVTGLEPLRDLGHQNPGMYGMLVRAGSKSGVILPGETRDPYYQLVQCKLKAGIKPNQPCQIYRIKADVYR